MINLTLNQLKRPALSNLVPKFGTKVEKNDINKGGLSTEEVDRNVTLPFELMREVEVSSSDTTTKIQYDAKIAIVGSDPVTLTLDKASYKGCVITITNRSTEQATIVLSEGNQKNIESKKSLVLEWDGTAWNDTALVVDSTVSENSNKPVSSAAVYQKATEITEAYTQAIAGETTARSEAITAVEQKVTEETSARTQADTALGTRIDEEVAARTEADTQLGTRIDAEIGTLSALTTTAKDSIVGAVNELDADIGNEVTARTEADTALGTRVDNEVTAREQADTALGTRIDGEVTARTDADTALGTRIDTEVGTLSALTTTAKDNVVAAINEVNDKVGTGGGDTGSTASNCEQFSFVVDSNEKLAAWANNDKSSGQDYTSVLIKSGTWTSNTGVNLTTAGTKVVVGEPKSKLVFSDSEKGLYYIDPPNNPEYYILGVTVKSTYTSPGGLTYCYAFHSCSNLTNCTGTGIAESIGDGSGYGFFNCTHLTNCEGRGNAESTGSGNVKGYGFANCGNLTGCYGTSSCTSTFTGSGYGFYTCTDVVGCSGVGVGAGKGERAGSGFGFYSCSYLSNCSGSGAGNGMEAGSGYSFVECDNLTNCRGTIVRVTKGCVFERCSNLMNCIGKITLSGSESSDCFYRCSNLLNCTGTSTINGSGIARGFWECSFLTNCIASGTSAGGGGYGFINSSNLTNCQGTGITKGQSVGVVGYGFQSCMYTMLSKAGGHCTTNVFQDCYSTTQTSPTYACADTPNGGFNNTTNPAA